MEGGADPIHHWMTIPMLHFEPPASCVRRFWSGFQRLVGEAAGDLVAAYRFERNRSRKSAADYPLVLYSEFTDEARYPRAPIGGHQSDWSRKRPVSTEQMIAAMDKAGVDKAVLVQASSAYAFDNSYTADSVAAHPERFTGVFSVDVLAPDAVEKMRHWMDRKLTGMRLFTTGSTMPGQATWFSDPRTYPAWDHAGETGLPVCMQMTKEGFPQLRELMQRFPKGLHIPLDDLRGAADRDGRRAGRSGADRRYPLRG